MCVCERVCVCAHPESRQHVLGAQDSQLYRLQAGQGEGRDGAVERRQVGQLHRASGERERRLAPQGGGERDGEGEGGEEEEDRGGLGGHRDTAAVGTWTGGKEGREGERGGEKREGKGRECIFIHQ